MSAGINIELQGTSDSNSPNYVEVRFDDDGSTVITFGSVGCDVTISMPYEIEQMLFQKIVFHQMSRCEETEEECFERVIGCWDERQ